MSDLPARGHCLMCNCAAPVFFTPDRQFSYQPQSLEDQCEGCPHPYFGHTLVLRDNPSDPNNQARKGINLQHGCGGFVFPRNEAWAPTQLCLACKQPWSTHALPDAMPTAPAPQPRANPATGTAHTRFTFARPPPPAAIYTAVLPREHNNPRPISNFEEDELRGTYLEERERSRIMNLPQHSSTSRTRIAAAASRSTSSRGRGRGGVKRKASNTRQNVFAPIDISSSEEQDVKPKKGKTKMTRKTVGLKRRYLVCVLPFCHGANEEPGNPSPKYQFKTMEDTRPLMRALQTYSLSFETEFTIYPNSHPQPPEIWLELDGQVEGHLAAHDIQMVHPPKLGGAKILDQLPWAVLEAKSNSMEKNRNLTQLPVYGYQFTEARLYEACKNVLHPDNPNIAMLFIAPKYKNLWGPISFSTPSSPLTEWPQPDLHRCFPWHVWDQYNGDGEEVACFNDSCVVSPAVAASSHNPRKRLEHPTSDNDGEDQARHNRRRVRDDQSRPVIDLSHDSDMEKAKLRSPSPHFPFALMAGNHAERALSPTPSVEVVAAPLPPLPSVKQWERPTDNELFEWQNNIFNVINDGPEKPVDITGPSLEAISRTLFSAVRTNRYPEIPFVVEAGVTCLVRPSDLGFLSPYRSYIVHNSGEPAVGEGIERGHFTVALSLRVCDPTRVKEQSRWASSGEFYRPTFHEKAYMVGSPRCQEYYVDGRYSALCLVQLVSGPLPICPIFLYIATQQNRQCLDDLSLAYIATLDPPTARVLQPWFEIEPHTVFSVTGDPANPGSDESHLGLMLATTLIGVSINEFAVARTPEFHKELNRRVLAVYFTGFENPWEHAEVLAFQTGLNLGLSEHVKLSDFWGTEMKVRRLLIGFYDRTVKTPNDITRVLLYTTVDEDQENINLFFKLFQWRFQKWLMGVGIPDALKSRLVTNSDGSTRIEQGIVADEIYRAHKGSRTIRSTTFLASLTETILLPVSNADKLMIRLHFTDFEDHASHGETRIVWHTCHRTMDVYFNPWLKNLLLEPCQLDDYKTDTKFDNWMSEITSLKGGDYNRA
ncbi:hypothetical protein R3P38DRAFT_3357243 [Favolaschia claudopus]|uniref:Uncharacterized protein n=1 Tax=Favolaschia claudopus TaxID=2862362 RepID=A0AAW0B7X9_9AGAR